MKEYEFLLETYNRALLKGKCKNKGDFAELLGTSAETLSRAFKNDPKYLTQKLIDKLKRFRDNEKLNDSDMEYQEFDKKESIDYLEYQLPLIPIDAVAGFNGVDDNGVCLSDCPQYVVPEFHQVQTDFLIRVSGSSMYPKYSSGDILACRYVREITFIQWGKVYVIDSQQGAMVKRLYEIDGDSEHILCKSDNEDYPPFKLPKDEIRSLSIVVGSIRLE